MYVQQYTNILSLPTLNHLAVIQQFQNKFTEFAIFCNPKREGLDTWTGHGLVGL